MSEWGGRVTLAGGGAWHPQLFALGDVQARYLALIHPSIHPSLPPSHLLSLSLPPKLQVFVCLLVLNTISQQQK